MSNYTPNSIYDYLATALEDVEPTIKCYSRYTERLESFPAAMIYLLDITEPERYRTLADDSSVWRPTVEIQLFSNIRNGSSIQLGSMVDAVLIALRDMNFRILSIRPVPGSDPNIDRRVIRAERYIGGADEMPSDENP